MGRFQLPLFGAVGRTARETVMDDVMRAWIAGAQAARAADVAEVRRLADRHSAEVRRYYAETSTASEQWLAHARCEGAAGQALGTAGNVLVALPLPSPPPQTAPAPPQSPLPSPDGGTGPQGDGAPAGGLSVAAGDGPTVEAWRVVVEGEGDEGPEVWPVEVWREGDGWACEDILAATRRSRGPTPEAAILRRTVFRAGARLRELVPPGMRTADERVAHALASRRP